MANIHINRPSEVRPAQSPMAASMPRLQNGKKIKCKHQDAWTPFSFHSFKSKLRFDGKIFYLSRSESFSLYLIFVYMESGINNALNLQVASTGT